MRFYLSLKIRKRPNARDKLTIFLTDTYACQTCFIPITNYFRAYTRLRLPFLTLFIHNQYSSQHAPFIMQGTCVRSVHKASGLLQDYNSYCLIEVLLVYYKLIISMYFHALTAFFTEA